MILAKFRSHPGNCARRFWRSLISVSLSLLALPGSPALAASGNDPAAIFDQGNNLYEQSKFAEAAAAYEKLVELGQVSSAVYFNLGNASFKSGQIGRAIAHYRIAEQLAPRDPDVRANLQFARNTVGGPGARPGRWRGWIQYLTLNEWTVLATSAFWLWLAFLAFGRWRKTWNQTLRGYTATTGVLAGILFVCLAVAAYDRLLTQSAVVIAHEAVVRYGPVDESQSFYTARDGTELTVLDRKGDWLQVADRASRTGWVRQDQVLMLPGARLSPSTSG